VRVKGPDAEWDPILNGVSSLGPSDTWAVGYSQDIDPGDTDVTLISHWDGTGWTVVDSPNPHRKDGNLLNDVAAVSSSDAWAVGAGNANFHTKGSLILHWDGQEWTVA
jgi:hypothetical protein